MIQVTRLQPLLIGVALLAVGGCQGMGSRSAAPMQPAVRSASETAPADLQLTCASEASTRFGVANVLPVSSALAQPGVYRVDLNTGGGSAVCMIDNNGTVLSVERLG